MWHSGDRSALRERVTVPEDDPEPWCTDDPVSDDVIYVMDTVEDDTNERH